jgi:hypothetical protein
MTKAKTVETKEASSTTDAKKSPFKRAIENLPFFDFNSQKTFFGKWLRDVTLGEGEKEFKAHVFVNIETGEEVFVTASYSIGKALEKARTEYPDLLNELVFSIEFLGKTTIKGKPFNQFNIGYCTEEEYNSYVG